MLRNLIFTLIFTCICSITSAQVDLDQKIDFRIENMSVPSALISLGQSANISIAFQSNLFDPVQLVTLDLKNHNIRSILDKCLAGTGITYKIEGGQIILFRKARKKYTISGYIQDSESGEKLVLATIYSEATQQHTISNDYGYYSLEHPEGEVNLFGNYIGYEGAPLDFSLSKDTTINIIMDPYLTLAAVTITDQEINSADRRYQIGQGEVVVPDDLSSQPALGGETDVYRYLQTQAGVQGGADGLGGLHVRGGNAEHNLVLLDGVPVFNPSHSLGLFSIFNSNVVKSLRFVKDGFSARYGGRLASVVDVRTKEGNTQKTTGELEIGTIATKGIIEIPVVKNKSALLLSERRTHIDPFLRNYSSIQKSKDYNEGQTDYSFYDINVKFHSEINDRDKVYFSYYRGGDKFNDVTEWEGIYIDFDTNAESNGYSFQNQQLNWSNELTSFRWNHVFGNHIFANITGTYSRYNYASLNEIIDSDDGDIDFPYEANLYDSRSQVLDYGLRIDVDHYVNEIHQFKYGTAILYRDFTPSSYLATSEFDEIDVEAVNTIIDSSATFIRYRAQEYSGYIEDKINLGGDSELLIGLRASGFQATNETYISLEPRLSFGFALNKSWKGRLSAARSTQFLHVLSSSDAGLPTDLWVPSTDDVGPQQAWQYCIGALGIWDNGWSIDIGLYYKTMTGLLSYDEDSKQPGLVESDPEYWEEFVSIGTGKSHGFEISANKSTGKNQVSFNYTYSKSERQFNDVNEGEVFPFSFDRPHSLNINYAYYFNGKTSLQLGWHYSSGRPITLQETDARFVALSNSIGIFEQVSATNAFRLPDYNRMDINLQMQFGEGSTRHLLNLGVYNVFNQKNPYYEYLLNDFDGAARSEQLNALPLLPSVSYKIQFGK